MGLSNKQRAFIEEYLKDFNATQAAIRAGYSERSAGVIGSQNLKKLNISEEIKRRIEEKTMSANEVLIRLADIARSDMGDFLRFIEGIKDPYLDLEGAKEKGLLKLVKKFKYNSDGRPEIELYDAHSALVDIGKAHGLFSDRIELTGDITIKKGYGVISPDDWDTTDDSEK